ncbi:MULTISPECIES: alpha/beta hydrolase [Vagococcus]|uniref:alpha/beta fold hydrolase n=1 Tax=Vagococcus TaxID=2737 RepID=UPI002FC836BF
MVINSNYIHNNDVRIHFLESGIKTEEVPSLLFIPGMLGSADQYETELKEFYPMHSIAISLRGNGKSDMPLGKFAFENYYSDIETVINHYNLNEIHLVGHSMGALLAIETAVKYPESVRSLIILDYPFKFNSFSKNWIDKTASFGYDEAHLENIFNDFHSIDLTEDLKKINCPVLVIQGKESDSKLTEEHIKVYKQNLKQVKTITFENSGHEISKSDYQNFISTINKFIEIN